MPIFKALEKTYYNNAGEKDIDLINKSIRDYENCAIGSIRKKFGLDVGVFGESYNCYKCKQLADEFPSKYEQILYKYEEIESYKDNSIAVFRLQQDLKVYQQEYESLLLDTKRHFRMIHQKELNN